nr:hypothetical protein [Tanacetum cinerariifolium]
MRNWSKKREVFIKELRNKENYGCKFIQVFVYGFAYFKCKHINKLQPPVCNCDSRNVAFNEVVGEPFVVAGMSNRGADNFNL